MNIIFAGTPEFAAAHLQALIDAQFDIVAVYTQPDRPAGRGKKLTPSPVKQLAISHDIPVEQPQHFKNDSEQVKLASYGADVMVVVAYGIILPKQIINTPRLGCINVHGSLLPKWRGAAPIQRSIWAGDKTTGVTIMLMDEGLDTGPMLNKATIEIDLTDTSADLYKKLADLGPPTLVETLQNFDSYEPEKQVDGDASYAKKLSKEEAQLVWTTPAIQLERNVRAFNPWPVAWFNAGDKKVKVWQAEMVNAKGNPGEILCFDKTGLIIACAKDALKLTIIQLPNKRSQHISDVANGHPTLFNKGDILA